MENIKYYYFYPLELTVTSNEIDITYYEQDSYTEISELVYNTLNK